MSYTFDGTQQTIVLPTYNNFVGSSLIPYNNGSGHMVTVEVSQNNFHSAPTTTGTYPNYAARTKDFYSTIELSAQTTFYNDAAKTNTTNVPVTITETSPCITPGTTYYVDLFALGSAQDENSAVATTASNGEGTVTGPFHVTVNPFPGGITADVVLSH